jgi:predicted transcriptional regulator
LATIARNKQQILATGKRAEQLPRRTKYEIWTEILGSCVKMQRTKFWLTSRLGLSWKVVDESLRFLTAAELIEASEPLGRETTKYKTTARGREALSVYKLLVRKFFSTH